MSIQKRLMTALAAGVLMAAMLPGVASARSDQTNLGHCVSEAKHALKGSGIKLKIGHFDDIVLGTNNDDTLKNPPGPTLMCGFGGSDRVATNIISAGDVFVGGDGGDSIDASYGTILGGNGSDVVEQMDGGYYDGGPGVDFLNEYHSGICVNVEADDNCPSP